MKNFFQTILQRIQQTALYMVLFSLYFGIGWVLQRLDKMFSYPLALLLLLYFPALLMLGITRSRLEAFTIHTLREGMLFLAIFAGIIVAERFLPPQQQTSPFAMIFPVILCVKTFTIFRNAAKNVDKPISSELEQGKHDE